MDKFQGQKAPIAIYSAATSSHADAPRGMEFLYSLSAERRELSRQMRVDLRRLTPDLRSGLPRAAANSVGKRPLPLFRNSGTDFWLN